MYTEAWARLIGWLLTEILFSRAGLWLLLSALLGLAGYAIGGRIDPDATDHLAGWLLGGAGLLGGLFLFHWLLGIGRYQRYQGDMTLSELEDESNLSLHERFLRRGR